MGPLQLTSTCLWTSTDFLFHYEKLHNCIYPNKMGRAIFSRSTANGTPDYCPDRGLDWPANGLLYTSTRWQVTFHLQLAEISTLKTLNLIDVSVQLGCYELMIEHNISLFCFYPRVNTQRESYTRKSLWKFHKRHFSWRARSKYRSPDWSRLFCWKCWSCFSPKY